MPYTIAAPPPLAFGLPQCYRRPPLTGIPDCDTLEWSSLPGNTYVLESTTRLD
jgi:hypothetical protein